MPSPHPVSAKGNKMPDEFPTDHLERWCPVRHDFCNECPVSCNDKWADDEEEDEDDSDAKSYLEINRIAERACNSDTSRYDACEWAIQEALRLVANRAATAVDWISVTERLPDKEERLWYWVVPKTAEEAYRDSSDNPIIAKFEPHRHEGKWGTWSGLSKPTHWVRLPAPPVLPADKEKGRG